MGEFGTKKGNSTFTAMALGSQYEVVVVVVLVAMQMVGWSIVTMQAMIEHRFQGR